jgi:hypothetical protein
MFNAVLLWSGKVLWVGVACAECVRSFITHLLAIANATLVRSPIAQRERIDLFFEEANEKLLSRIIQLLFARAR